MVEDGRPLLTAGVSVPASERSSPAGEGAGPVTGGAGSPLSPEAPGARRHGGARGQGKLTVTPRSFVQPLLEEHYQRVDSCLPARVFLLGHDLASSPLRYSVTTTDYSRTTLSSPEYAVSLLATGRHIILPQKKFLYQISLTPLFIIQNLKINFGGQCSY